MTAEERLLRLENAFTTLVELARNMDERLDDHHSRLSTLETNLSALSDIVAEVAKSQRRTDEQLKIVAASQRQTEEQLKIVAASQRQTEEQLKIVSANQRRTDEQLNSLAATVERYIRGDSDVRP